MPTVAEFNAVHAVNPARANRLLFSWLSDDDLRAQLYDDAISKKTALKFESRAIREDNPKDLDEDRPKSYRQDAWLVIHPDHVDAAYSHSSSVTWDQLQWSHAPYASLGGTFMLALDEPTDYRDNGADPFRSPHHQRQYCYTLLQQFKPAHLDAIATVAFKAGALLPLKCREFDVAELAEMVAVNYVARLFGFSLADLPLLKETAHHVGNGLMHVNMGQHFITDPAAIPLAKQALAAVTQRAAALIDLYDHQTGKDEETQWENLQDEFDKLRRYSFEAEGDRTAPRACPLEDFFPLMQMMASGAGQRVPALSQQFSTTEKAIMVTGLVSGTITNLRAAVCIAVRQFFSLPANGLEKVRSKAVDTREQHRDANWTDESASAFRALVEEALRVNPPPPFVPRKAAQDIELNHSGNDPIKAGTHMIIAVGGGSWVAGGFRLGAEPGMSDPPGTPSASAKHTGRCPFSKAFGGPPELVRSDGRAEYLHSCIGKDMAMHSITYTVRQLMVLPGLTQTLDKKTGEAVGLIKRAGFICERYPLEYERDKLLRQSPLQTVLPVKNPVPEHAAALRKVLQYGAPFIEKVLREARHVHFASFIFLDNDSKLVLFTAYDGDFDAYIGHFAREFGPLFDRFFAHIEDGPPAPIKEHAFEFVQFIRRFQQPSVGNLFFSAYPEADATMIGDAFNPRRKFDFSTLEGAP